MRYIVVPIHPLPDVVDLRAESHGPVAPEPTDGLDQWTAAARMSYDACLVIDTGGCLAAVSPTAADLLGTPSGEIVGRPLDDVLHLLDFSDAAHEAQGVQRRIPPLIAIRENSLSRGVMRVRRPDGARLMLDAVAAPIHDDERRPIGSVSFLAAV